MNLRVHGCKDIALQNEIEKAARFYAKELLSPRLLPYIEVDIEMRTTIRDLGNCMVTYYNDWYKAREFEMQIKRHRSLKTTLSTLAHEFVHLKQFAYGELNCANTKWKGQHIDTENISYYDLPWEVEASSMERVLYHLYMDNRVK
jgi:hypothetical protein